MRDVATILAIDPATRTGLAEGAPGSVPRLTIKNFRGDPTDAPEDIFQRVTFFFASRLRDEPLPTHVFIEAPVPPSGIVGATNHNTTLITIGIYAIVVGIVRCKHIPIHRAPIGSWRKYFLGKGNLSGAEAKRRAAEVCRLLAWDAPDHNAAEAAGIWAWGCAQIAPELAPRIEPLFVRGAPR